MSKNVILATIASFVLLMAFVFWRFADYAQNTNPASPNPQAPARDESLIVYSGRNEQLVGSLFRDFEQSTGIKVEVRYGETPQLAALLLEEGERSPADVYLAQDAGALGALAKAGRLAPLPPAILEQVPDERFKSPKGDWIGLSGRARVLAYNSRQVETSELPNRVAELTHSKWQGRVGWAPTNASFQAFVTAFRVLEGEQAAREWLESMQANQPRRYKNNTAIIEALGRGEVDVGLVNHYYVFAAEKGRKEPLPVKNHYFETNDPGALINVAGVAQLASSRRPQLAHRLIEFLLSEPAQSYFAVETFEYPLARGQHRLADDRLRPIAEVGSPKLDLSELDALQQTLRLLQETGVL